MLAQLGPSIILRCMDAALIYQTCDIPKNHNGYQCGVSAVDETVVLPFVFHPLLNLANVTVFATTATGANDPVSTAGGTFLILCTPTPLRMALSTVEYPNHGEAQFYLRSTRKQGYLDLGPCAHQYRRGRRFPSARPP